MNRDAMAISYVGTIGHVLAEHNDAIDELTEKYGVPFEEFAAVVAPLTQHLYQHAYENGAHDEPYTDEQIAEMQAEAEKDAVNPLAAIVTGLDKDGNTIIDDSLCELLGTC